MYMYKLTHYFVLTAYIFGPGNGTSSATNVVLLVAVVLHFGIVFKFQIFKVLRLCRSSADRYETFNTSYR